ncbi:MAG: GAF domain-containing protein [Defluviitaleaceae bacterium]|nr:GAF domain-containing protein [Defluviitaleaceae bacterium]
MYRVKRQEDIESNYKLMAYMAKRVLEDDKDDIASLANISAVINGYMDRINWVGFYIMKDGELVLGPFQGLPACIRIQVGKGVCGTAVAERKTQIVPNVHNFAGHIACDSASLSEIVIPIYKNGEVYGVLDVDSPVLNRFGELEDKYLQEICTQLGAQISGV